MECEVCNFKNPKGTATAIIIKDNKLLLLKRNEEPFKDMWDLPGGYMSGEKEGPEETLRRELNEELGLQNVPLTFMKVIMGTSQWKGQTYPTLNQFFLAEIQGDLQLNTQENSEYQFVDLADIRPGDIAFTSNQKMIEWLKEHFVFDLARVRELIGQLDSSASLNEQYLYKAILGGFVSKIYDGKKLVGMGWIFPRQTLLRRQAVVEDMIVDNAYRGKGYGEKLLLELLDWAKKEQMDMVELTTNPARIAANGLYKKVGFVLHPTNHYLFKAQ